MKIFSVTLLIFLTHSLSFTMGTRASRILRGMGPAERNTLKTGKSFSSQQGGVGGGRQMVKVAPVSVQPTPFPSLDSHGTQTDKYVHRFLYNGTPHHLFET